MNLFSLLTSRMAAIIASTRTQNHAIITGSATILNHESKQQAMTINIPSTIHTIRDVFLYFFLSLSVSFFLLSKKNMVQLYYTMFFSENVVFSSDNIKLTSDDIPYSIFSSTAPGTLPVPDIYFPVHSPLCLPLVCPEAPLHFLLHSHDILCFSLRFHVLSQP